MQQVGRCSVSCCECQLQCSFHITVSASELRKRNRSNTVPQWRTLGQVSFFFNKTGSIMTGQDSIGAFKGSSCQVSSTLPPTVYFGSSPSGTILVFHLLFQITFLMDCGLAWRFYTPVKVPPYFIILVKQSHTYVALCTLQLLSWIISVGISVILECIVFCLETTLILQHKRQPPVPAKTCQVVSVCSRCATTELTQ